MLQEEIPRYIISSDATARMMFLCPARVTGHFFDRFAVADYLICS
jgi:hypothetical protein